ncbi:MAG: alanine racemase [Deltaproteobacteria bacterium]|nr:alanine racemase [Deltaproteobacteria bacterium]MDL1988390.1 alanine racemase [Deltaproteobacteria bacterium]MDL2124518.1 alanine racemase [Deltaproteobacteria bacterium]
MDSPLVWAEVDLKAIAHNIRELRSITNPKARFMAIVKANAYGHDIIEVARRSLENGAEALGVANIEEGIQLRKAGIDAPVLIFGYTSPIHVKKLIELDLTQTVYSYETSEKLSQAATAYGKKIKVHIKVDTGMGRLGLLRGIKDNSLSEVESISRLPMLELEGIYTHFATADKSDRSYAGKQFEIFMDFLNQLRIAGLEIAVTHAANSAAIINMPETHLDMVRAGISIYGLYTSEEVDRSIINLKPAMALKTKIIHLKKVPAGFKVSYGTTYETEKPTTIATVSIGYADGLNRLLSSKGRMLVCGQSAPIVGRICMDMTMLDVGEIPEIVMEQEVVVFGKQGNSSITVDEIASTINTINYEVVSTIMERVPRIYLR